MKDEKKIAKGFLPHTHSEMLRELKFNEPCFAVIYADGMVMTGNEKWVDIMLRKDATCIKSISYQQAEEWLWENHRLRVSVYVIVHYDYKFDLTNKEESLNDKKYDGKNKKFDSPITANRKGILKAIEYLHLNRKKKK